MLISRSELIQHLAEAKLDVKEEERCWEDWLSETHQVVTLQVAKVRAHPAIPSALYFAASCHNFLALNLTVLLHVMSCHVSRVCPVH